MPVGDVGEAEEARAKRDAPAAVCARHGVCGDAAGHGAGVAADAVDLAGVCCSLGVAVDDGVVCVAVEAYDFVEDFFDFAEVFVVAVEEGLPDGCVGVVSVNCGKSEVKLGMD